MKTVALLFAVAALAACSDRQPAAGTAAPPESSAPAATTPAEPVSTGNDTGADPMPSMPPAPADGAKVEADYLGRWAGVEGMYRDVTQRKNLERELHH